MLISNADKQDIGIHCVLNKSGQTTGLHNIQEARHAYQPSLEHAARYHHLFQQERGREYLFLHRRELCRMVRKQWSPTWAFDMQHLIEQPPPSTTSSISSSIPTASTLGMLKGTRRWLT